MEDLWEVFLGVAVFIFYRRSGGRFRRLRLLDTCPLVSWSIEMDVLWRFITSRRGNRISSSAPVLCGATSFARCTRHLHTLHHLESLLFVA